jgi:hypothetical protein
MGMPFMRPSAASADFESASGGQPLEAEAPMSMPMPVVASAVEEPKDTQQAASDTSNAAAQGQGMGPNQPMAYTGQMLAVQGMDMPQGQMNGQMQRGMPMPAQGMAAMGQGMPMQMMNQQGMPIIMNQQNMQQMMVQQGMMMGMPADPQGWNQQMNGQMYGQAPAGWIMVPMGPMMDGQQQHQQQAMMQPGMYDYGMQGMGYGMHGGHMRMGMGMDDKRRSWNRRRKEDGRRVGGDESKKVFVGGLGPGTSAKTLRSYFCQFGNIVDCAVIADGTTRRSRGFGFVEFGDEIPEGVLDVDHTIEQRRCGVRPYSYRSIPGQTQFLR